MYRKSTLKKLNPTARKLAKYFNELEKNLDRSKKLIGDINRLELDSLALFNKEKARKGQDFIDDSMIEKVAKDIQF